MCYTIGVYLGLGLLNSGKAQKGSEMASYSSIKTEDSTIGINMATDFVFAIIPIPLIWNLQLNIRAKVVLIAILSLGIL